MPARKQSASIDGFRPLPGQTRKARIKTMMTGKGLCIVNHPEWSTPYKSCRRDLQEMNRDGETLGTAKAGRNGIGRTKKQAKIPVAQNDAERQRALETGSSMKRWHATVWNLIFRHSALMRTAAYAGCRGLAQPQP